MVRLTLSQVGSPCESTRYAPCVPVGVPVWPTETDHPPPPSARNRGGGTGGRAFSSLIKYPDECVTPTETSGPPPFNQGTTSAQPYDFRRFIFLPAQAPSWIISRRVALLFNVLARCDTTVTFPGT